MPLEVKAFYLFSLLPKSYSLEVSLKSQLLQSLKSDMQENGAQLYELMCPLQHLLLLFLKGLDSLCHFSPEIKEQNWRTNMKDEVQREVTYPKSHNDNWFIH